MHSVGRQMHLMHNKHTTSYTRHNDLGKLETGSPLVSRCVPSLSILSHLILRIWKSSARYARFATHFESRGHCINTLISWALIPLTLSLCPLLGQFQATKVE